MNKIQPQTWKGTFFRNFSLLALLSLLWLGGCGGQGEAPISDSGSVVSSESASAPAAASNAGGSTAGAKLLGSPSDITAQLIQSASTVPRKIVYNATVDLISDNFATAQSNLLGLVRKNQGYVAETSIGGTPGKPRQGTWKIRIPEGQFASFMGAVVKLGELQTTHTDSQDVTAEFYDLQARISNKQVEEQRLLNHLQRSTAKLSDILQIEREISRVRGEIEQMQGQLRLLANTSALATVTVTINEVKGYVPPKPAGSQVGRSFEGSTTAMVDLGKDLVVVLAALLPWGVLVALIGIPVWLVARRFAPKP